MRAYLKGILIAMAVGLFFLLSLDRCEQVGRTPRPLEQATYTGGQV